MEEKIAIITGGSRGIGRACAILLAQNGYRSIITFVNREDAALEVVKEIQSQGHQAEAYKLDVGDDQEAQQFIEKIIEKHKKIDLLVNNAGITKDGLFMRMNKEDWDNVIHTNLTGVYHITKPVVKQMVKQKSGNIINMTSISGVAGNPGQANYSSAKAGLIGLTKSLARELASRNIRVNAVAPGFIETDMTKDLPKEKILGSIPLNRLGTPEDVAHAVLFFAESGSYITGQVLHVDGGIII